MNHTMIGVPRLIESDEDIIKFMSIGLSSIIENVCEIYEDEDEDEEDEEDEDEESDKDDEEEDEDEDDFQDIYNNSNVLIKVVDIWLSSKEDLSNEQEEEIERLTDENNSLYIYIDKLLLYIDDMNKGNVYDPPKNTTCKDGSLDMRLIENKGKQKIPYEKQIIGNTHNSYISHPRCKLCKMSICGRCVKHGG